MFSFLKNIFSSKKNDAIVIEQEEKFETPIVNYISEPRNIIEPKPEIEVKPKTQEELEEAE